MRALFVTTEARPAVASGAGDGTVGHTGDVEMRFEARVGIERKGAVPDQIETMRETAECVPVPLRSG